MSFSTEEASKLYQYLMNDAMDTDIKEDIEYAIDTGKTIDEKLITEIVNENFEEFLRRMDCPRDDNNTYVSHILWVIAYNYLKKIDLEELKKAILQHTLDKFEKGMFDNIEEDSDEEEIQ